MGETTGAAQLLDEAAARLRADAPERYDVLVFTLALAVPLRISELADFTPGQLSNLGNQQARIVGSHGDDLMFGGRHTRQAFNALATGIACAALLADGGITALGRHWCTRPHYGCPYRKGDA